MIKANQLTTHSFIYRDFVIVKLPRKAITPITRYHVWYENNSFGKFDAMDHAQKYIDKLYQNLNILGS
ncbi:hypothetical protein [Arsenophonus nasoniae]|uniref:Uncharacterized protein n=1 Tax=Arsenophonus nasoniae TaxID=638 RepID=A0AA95JZ68_9GAMM|nr:hypothetical protein [Arsenophonus nasoniae]WGL93974.1 hypothetical protein QE207_01390 [Arsenophonus nasoniae]WGL94074.1 hypothetical protein QE207_01870 [Arsenophonus nasoniae]